MSNIYYQELNIPNLFLPCYQDIKINKSFEKILPINDINIEFKEWLAFLNIGLTDCRFFSALPYHKYTLHKDVSYIGELSKQIVDCVKINLIYNSNNSKMRWYSLKPDITPSITRNKVGETIKIYNEEDCNFIFEANTNGPVCLVNGMIIHTLFNGNSTRHCYSMPLINLTTKKRLTWHEANIMLAEYIN
jgi:hypothetical protein